MADLKQRKVVLSFYVFGNSFPPKLIPFPLPQATQFVKHKEER